MRFSQPNSMCHPDTLLVLSSFGVGLLIRLSWFKHQIWRTRSTIHSRVRPIKIHGVQQANVCRDKVMLKSAIARFVLLPRLKLLLTCVLSVQGPRAWLHSKQLVEHIALVSASGATAFFIGHGPRSIQTALGAACKDICCGGCHSWESAWKPLYAKFKGRTL